MKATSRHTTDKPPVPRYLCVRMSKPLYVALAQFRLSAHHLAMVQGRRAGVPYLLWGCPLETDDPLHHEVQDEARAVLRCQFEPVVQLRQRFSNLFACVPETSDDLQLFVNQSDFPAVALFISLCKGAVP